MKPSNLSYSHKQWKLLNVLPRCWYAFGCGRCWHGGARVWKPWRISSLFMETTTTTTKTPWQKLGSGIPLCQVQIDSFMAESNDAVPCQSLAVHCSVPRMLNTAPARETNWAEGWTIQWREQRTEITDYRKYLWHLEEINSSLYGRLFQTSRRDLNREAQHDWWWCLMYGEGNIIFSSRLRCLENHLRSRTHHAKKHI